MFIVISFIQNENTIKTWGVYETIVDEINANEPKMCFYRK